MGGSQGGADRAPKGPLSTWRAWGTDLPLGQQPQEPTRTFAERQGPVPGAPSLSGFPASCLPLVPPLHGLNLADFIDRHRPPLPENAPGAGGPRPIHSAISAAPSPFETAADGRVHPRSALGAASAGAQDWVPPRGPTLGQSGMWDRTGDSSSELQRVQEAERQPRRTALAGSDDSRIQMGAEPLRQFPNWEGLEGTGMFVSQRG